MTKAMTQIFVLFFFVLGGFGLWGQQQDPDKPARDARIKAEREENLRRVAEETKKNLEDHANLIQESILRSEASIKDSIDRTEAAVQQSLSRNNGWGGGGRAAMPVYEVRQEGSVAIAKHAEVTVDPLACLERATAVMRDADKAAAYCQKIFKEESGRSKKVANEAADATKSSQPMVLLPRW